MTEETFYNDFVKNIQQLLKAGNAAEALKIFKDDRTSLEVKNNSWDLIPVITHFLTSSQKKNNISIFQCCETLIDIVATNSNPEEAVLQFIEEIEEAEDDTKFVSLLKPIQKVIIRIPKRRSNSLAWCFNSIYTFLNKCEIPENTNLVGKEKLLLDSDEATQTIINRYTELLPFYREFTHKFALRDEDHKEQYLIGHRYLIRLLGRPLVYLDMEEFNSIKSKARIIAENLLDEVFMYSKDPVSLLNSQKSIENVELIKLDSMGLAALFHLVYSEQVLIEHVPKVYCPFYFFQNSLHLATILLSYDHQIVIEKGLQLAKTLLEHVRCHKLPHSMLDSGDHNRFCTALSNVIVYNHVKAVRKFALNIYKDYLLKFDTHGFYLLIDNLMSVLTHSGLKGFTITLYKDILANELTLNQELLPYFKGEKLMALLRKFCQLSKNEESDLIELSDQIMASLNLLRYLILRDRNNITNIQEHILTLEDTFFNPLRKSIDLSRAHYDLRIREIQEEKARGDKKGGDTEISISVGKEYLQDMSNNEKLKVLRSFLTAFDVMESLLTRLIECIESVKR